MLFFIVERIANVLVTEITIYLIIIDNVKKYCYFLILINF
ncbi:hypothetical protein BC749_105277 [Flavobacterium araucananum]|nr:hypothetical protein BC749_105277 [Flavobacterium araucananum]